MFPQNGEKKVVAYSDADWESDLNDRKPISGCILTTADEAICWNSKKQSMVTQSTAEAEYSALFFTVQESLWVRQLLNDLGQEVGTPISVNEDNQTAIRLTENPVNHRKTEHISVKYHFTRHAQENDLVKVKYCPTKSMIADMLTKPLSKPKLQEFCRAVGLIPEPGISIQGE